MNHSALISIIVTIYNIEKYVAKCIESIIDQTYTDIEIILVDDGSADQSGAICDIYEKKDSRIHVIHKANGGLSDARNHALDIVHGDFITFVDGDDYIAPDMCEKLLKAVLTQNADIAICNYQIISDNEDGQPKDGNVDSPIKNEVITGRVVLEEKVIGLCGWIWAVSWNKLYRKELFRDLRFPFGKLHEDEFVCFDLFSKCDFVACVEDALYYYVRREGSIMTSPYSVRRLDGCEAYLQRAEQMLSNGYSSESIFKTIMGGINLLCAVFNRKLYRDPAYQKRYRELLQQFRKLGFIRMLRNCLGIKRKLCLVLCYISPALYWGFGKTRFYLSRM